MYFRNGPTPSKLWEIGAATKATDALSGWTVSYDDGAGNYNYHLAVYGDGKIALGDSINDFNSSIFDVFGSTTLHDTLSIKTDHGPGYSFPVLDGFANYVLQTDGLGNLNWVDPSTLGASLWTDAGTETYLTDLTDSVGIGVSSPLTKLHVMTEGGANHIVSHTVSSANADDGGNLSLIRARGSYGSETEVLTGDRIGQITFNGYNSSTNDYEEGAYIAVVAEEDFMSTGAGSRMEFHTAQMGGTATEAMVISSNQNIGMGTSPSATSKLEVYTYDGDNAGYFSNNSNSNSMNTGVSAESFASGGGVDTNIGVLGNANGGGLQDIGIYGFSDGMASSYGLYGTAEGSGVNNYGVYGNAVGGTNNYAGYFNGGDVYITNGLILPTGAVDGYVLTSDAVGNATWEEPSSNNVVISLTNRTGATSNKGDVVVADPTNPNSFIFTNNPGNAAVLGVVYESGVANLGACKVAISGVVEVNVSGTPVLGQHCVTGATNGQATSVATPSAGTSIGVWVDATPGAEKVLLR